MERVWNAYVKLGRPVPWCYAFPFSVGDKCNESAAALRRARPEVMEAHPGGRELEVGQPALRLGGPGQHVAFPTWPALRDNVPRYLAFWSCVWLRVYGISSVQMHTSASTENYKSNLITVCAHQSTIKKKVRHIRISLVSFLCKTSRRV